MPRCPFADRECVADCRAYDESKTEKCLVLHRLDRTNMLLNFVEKKVGGKM